MRLLGIDIGGTFTDFALLDTGTGELRTHKLLTTPDDPVRAVLQGAREIMGDDPFPDRVVHGTTLVTNAVVERKGAVTALLTTRGFRDVLEIRREGRYDLYDLDLEFSEPLVPRHRRFEVDERVDETGGVLTPLDTEGLRTTLAGMEGLGIESLAVCLLHGYANPDHEQQVQDLVKERFPDLPVSLASELAPEIREYERTSTAVANAYVRPVAEGYLHRLGDGLKELAAGGKRGEPVLHIMLSDGGITHPETAAREPIRIVESGPAGGVIAADRIGRGLGDPKLLSLDMGGTTAKIAFLDEDGPRTRSMFEVDRRHLYKKGSGLPLLVPSLDLVEIGAGGGSLARRGPLGILEVGPESAGADPGPACYGKEGTGATVTDADLMLGLLNPDYFLGGAMALDVAAAGAALEREVARPLGLSLMEAANGVHTLVGSNMAAAARVHAAERGLDLAGHSLVAFGGAGPVHAWSVARQLRIPRVIFPGHAGVESALGFLAAAPAFEIARSWTAPVETLDESAARSMVQDLADRARGVVAAAGSGDPSVQVSVDMRYRGQGAEVRVPMSGLAVNRHELAKAFVARYLVLYGRAVTDVPVEAVTWRVRCSYPAPSVEVFDRAGESMAAANVPDPLTVRHAWLPDEDGPRETPVHRRCALEPGMVIEGPALVEEPECTLVIGRGTARILSGGTMLAEVAP
jgi:N-methylhydantoinase A